MQAQVIKYVLGFAFSPDNSKVLLIRKERPKWQSGLLNGVGGKVEGEEWLREAMVREFKEETDIDTSTTDWSMFLSHEAPAAALNHSGRPLYTTTVEL